MNKALSIRQPWAWLIVQGHKDIENRTWKTNYRGPLFIHASGSMTRDDYARALFRASRAGITLPPIGDFREVLGGIVGEVILADCVEAHASRWFTGPWGFVLQNAQPRPFHRCRGGLSLFPVNL